jgi:cytochrome b6-f complex iron-sulfur subunit
MRILKSCVNLAEKITTKEIIMDKNCNETEKNCSGRREFLVSASAIAGGLVLSLANVGQASAAVAPFADTVIKLDEASPLNKVGGSQTVDTPAGKVIIARTGDATWSAVSATCTHKGATLKYDEAAKQFACPSHGSRFNGDGSVAKGPAKDPLKSFKPQSAIVLTGE